MCHNAPGRTATYGIASNRDNDTILGWSSSVLALVRSNERPWQGRSFMASCDIALSACTTNGCLYMGEGITKFSLAPQVIRQRNRLSHTSTEILLLLGRLC